MFSLFKKNKTIASQIPTISDTSMETIMDQVMTLPERKEWRTEMVKKCIYDVMSALHISRLMYRYRILPIDQRSHIFVVMIETTQFFYLSDYTDTVRLANIEQMLKASTFDNYGIVIESVYWKATETIDIFEKVAITAKSPAKSKKTIADLQRDFAETEQAPLTSTYDPVSDAEAKAFKDALAKGIKPPPLHIGGKEYNTDLMPLDPK
jgi:hypothetical protein